VTRALADRTKQVSGIIKDRVISASEADGARESGLTALIWNQVMSLAADAMITVALAGTVFFAASGTQQRGNVLEYLLITMAPFAVVAPVIGPLLDRLQHGRRIAMGITGIGRAALAVVMAAHFDDLLVLLPCALGSLVLSKAYSVLRGSAAPRLVPPEMTLVTANARLSIFGLGATAVGGGALALFLRLTGSYQWGLRLTAVAFAVTAFYSFRLPKSVDAPQGGPRPMPTSATTVPAAKLFSSARLREWSKRGFGDEVLTSLQAQSALRMIIGFLTLFLAFYIQETSHGFDAALHLGLFAIAAGGGSFVGTAIGARLTLGRPQAVVVLCAIGSGVACVVTWLLFGVTMAIVCAAVVGVGNALGKLALDAIIQRDVNEDLRSSAFARSETFLQLAWVLGAALAVILPAGHGKLDLFIATVALCASIAGVLVRQRTLKAREDQGYPSASAYDPGYGPPGTPWGTQPPQGFGPPRD
jgi:MFS family permease